MEGEISIGLNLGSEIVYQAVFSAVAMEEADETPLYNLTLREDLTCAGSTAWCVGTCLAGGFKFGTLAQESAAQLFPKARLLATPHDTSSLLFHLLHRFLG